MAELKTTLGQILINEALPQDMRDYDRVLDKKSLTNLLRELKARHPDPDAFRDAAFKLANIGRESAYFSGGNSFGLEHLRKANSSRRLLVSVQKKLDQYLDDDSISDQQRSELIQKMVGKLSEKQREAIFEESLSEGNPLALQILSGSRGNKMNLASLRGADLLYTDHHDRIIPVPVLSSYSEGLRPEEYWAGAYGARKGVYDVKFATQSAGFLAKQLNQIAHRLLVVGDDAPTQGNGVMRGFPVSSDDPDNEGSLLARDTGPYKRNTVLTPKVMKHLSRLGHKRLLIRSPIVGGSPEGGIYARDAGVRERGVLPTRGEQVGLAAAQALSEPISQSQLSSKHSGGVAGGTAGAVSGFEHINQQIQIPKHIKGGAAHAKVDGTVQRIEAAPAGGYYVTIDGEQHYVSKGFDLKVKKGDEIEAGDVISEGIPNPAEIVKHKGVGEGRAYFVNAFRDALEASSISGHRRNVELLARGLINHVKLTDEMGAYIPDDIVPYSTMEHIWKPRSDAQTLDIRRAKNKYLERPYLHYSIGTKVRPSVIRNLQEFGVKDVDVHDEPPPFEPEMTRGMYSLQHDPDWVTRMLGSGLKKSLTSAVHRGGASDPTSTSYVPAIINPVDFGRKGLVQAPPRRPEEFRPKTLDDSTKIGFDQLIDKLKQLKRANNQANWSGTEGSRSGQTPKPVKSPATAGPNKTPTTPTSTYSKPVNPTGAAAGPRIPPTTLNSAQLDFLNKSRQLGQNDSDLQKQYNQRDWNADPGAYIPRVAGDWVKSLMSFSLYNIGEGGLRHGTPRNESPGSLTRAGLPSYQPEGRQMVHGYPMATTEAYNRVALPGDSDAISLYNSYIAQGFLPPGDVADAAFAEVNQTNPAAVRKSVGRPALPSRVGGSGAGEIMLEHATPREVVVRPGFEAPRAYGHGPLALFTANPKMVSSISNTLGPAMPLIMGGLMSPQATMQLTGAMK